MVTLSFFQVFAKNSLIKNVFVDEKNLIIEHEFGLESSSLLGVFWPRRGLQADHGTFRKNAIFPQSGNQKQHSLINTAYVNKEALLSR